MLNLLPSLIIFLLWGGSAVITALPFLLMQEQTQTIKLMYIACVPMIFIFSFSTLAGVFSRLGKRGIVTGKFPREPMHPVYLLRRIYNGCWTQLYYFKPIYSAVLAIPLLRKWIFRLFGYSGSTNFVVYPDTWIRDLPLLSIGKGSYLANRATIGSNMCFMDGTILVQGLNFSESVMIGHLALVGPGCKINQNSEVGINSVLGVRLAIDEGVKIGPLCGINHGTRIGLNTKVGTSVYIGIKCNIGSNLDIPAGALIADGTKIENQSQMTEYISVETKGVAAQLLNISDILRKELNVS